MLPGETVTNGGVYCPDCGDEFIHKVMMSAAGYYIGTGCACGPNSRESDYFKTWQEANARLKTGAYGRRG